MTADGPSRADVPIAWIARVILNFFLFICLIIRKNNICFEWWFLRVKLKIRITRGGRYIWAINQRHSVYKKNMSDKSTLVVSLGIINSCGYIYNTTLGIINFCRKYIYLTCDGDNKGYIQVAGRDIFSCASARTFCVYYIESWYWFWYDAAFINHFFFCLSQNIVYNEREWLAFESISDDGANTTVCRALSSPSVQRQPIKIAYYCCGLYCIIPTQCLVGLDIKCGASFASTWQDNKRDFFEEKTILVYR